MCLWSSLTGLWVWFPDIYAATVCNATDADTDAIKYDEATKEAAMVMITFPISAMVLGLAFTTFNLFNRIPKKLIFQSFNILLALVYAAILLAPSKGLFLATGVLIGFSSILINSGQFLLIDAYRSRDDYPKNRGLGSDNSVCTISGVSEVYFCFSIFISSLVTSSHTHTYKGSLGQLAGSLIISGLIGPLGSATNAVVCVGLFCSCTNVIICQFGLHYE